MLNKSDTQGDKTVKHDDKNTKHDEKNHTPGAAPMNKPGDASPVAALEPGHAATDANKADAPTANDAKKS